METFRYPGEWQYCASGGLCFKLPCDWSDDFGSDGQMLFCRDDYCITLAVETIDADLFDIERQVNADGWWNGDSYDACAGIIGSYFSPSPSGLKAFSGSVSLYSFSFIVVRF